MFVCCPKNPYFTSKNTKKPFFCENSNFRNRLALHEDIMCAIIPKFACEFRPNTAHSRRADGIGVLYIDVPFLYQDSIFFGGTHATGGRHITAYHDDSPGRHHFGGKTRISPSICRKCGGGSSFGVKNDRLSELQSELSFYRKK